jgi:hypothetical protein
MPETEAEPRYTLAEAKLELNRVACHELGHDWRIELAEDGETPAAVSCDRCGQRWPVAQEAEPPA